MFKKTIGKFLTRIGYMQVDTCCILSECMLLSKALRIGWQSCELL